MTVAAPEPGVDLVAVLEVGGSHVTSALVDRRAARVLPGSMRRRGIDPGASAETIVNALANAMTQLRAPAETSWVIAMPGPFDYDRGMAWFTDVGKFDSLYGLDLGAQLRHARPELPATVSFVNDADAFAVGEWRRGVCAGVPRCVGITLGSGVGSSFLHRGVPVTTGPTVPPEGRIHRLRIGPAGLEDVVSRRAILARYHRAVDPGATTDLDVRDVFARSRRGDVWAARVLNDAFQALGTALTPWLARFQATVLVVGGSMSGSWDLVRPALERGLSAQTDPEVALVRSADPMGSVLVGAALGAPPASA
ncbi:MAG: ROK family protein [Actinomycetota bacterium]|nr:ROK family protein [Actinomycetota bacterium]